MRGASTACVALNELSCKLMKEEKIPISANAPMYRTVRLRYVLVDFPWVFIANRVLL
jgi:hypothetical protein